MIWASWSDFLAMGGYGLYVWGSTIVVAFAVVIEVIAVRQRRKALLRRAEHSVGDGNETTA